MIHVKIVVQDGLVQEIYANTEDIDIDVLDMDADDTEQAEENEKEYNSISKEYPYIIWH